MDNEIKSISSTVYVHTSIYNLTMKIVITFRETRLKQISTK